MNLSEVLHWQYIISMQHSSAALHWDLVLSMQYSSGALHWDLVLSTQHSSFHVFFSNFKNQIVMMLQSKKIVCNFKCKLFLYSAIPPNTFEIRLCFIIFFYNLQGQASRSSKWQKRLSPNGLEWTEAGNGKSIPKMHFTRFPDAIPTILKLVRSFF